MDEACVVFSVEEVVLLLVVVDAADAVAVVVEDGGEALGAVLVELAGALDVEGAACAVDDEAVFTKLSHVCERAVAVGDVRDLRCCSRRMRALCVLRLS